MTLIGSGTITRKLVGSASLGTLRPTTTGGIEIDLLEGGDSTSAFTGESPATVQITVRKDTAANWNTNNPILADGEIGYVTDDKQFFVGDGVTAYNSFPDANFIVHWDDLISALSGINTSIANLESAVTGNTNDIATLDSGLQQEQLDRANGDITLQGNIDSLGTSVSSVVSAYAGVLELVNALDTRVDTTESSISTLSFNLSTESTSRNTADTNLQNQIDTINSSLSGGIMLRYTLQFNASDVPSVEGSPFDIITPTSGKTLQIISACIGVSASSPSTKSLSFEFSEALIQLTAVDDSIPDSTINLIILNSLQLTLKDVPLQLTLTNGGVELGDAQYTLTIFYMEV